ncbi:hypothetical protein C5B73_01930 [Nocardia cyriacigeorgica]|nr:hypothetical protein C5B73_01930 [Nocardia cyriacigeorgica]
MAPRRPTILVGRAIDFHRPRASPAPLWLRVSTRDLSGATRETFGPSGGWAEFGAHAWIGCWWCCALFDGALRCIHAPAGTGSAPVR